MRADLMETLLYWPVRQQNNDFNFDYDDWSNKVKEKSAWKINLQALF